MKNTDDRLKVTDAVARLLQLPRTPATCLGPVQFDGAASTMYAVADTVIAARQQPTGKPLSEFRNYCERALSTSLSNKSASLPTPASESIGHHDDLIPWLPRGGSHQTASIDSGAQRVSVADAVHAGLPPVVDRDAAWHGMVGNAAFGLRFNNALLEQGFGIWKAGVMIRVDVVGALLSLVLLAVPAAQLGWLGAALLLPPAAVLALAWFRRQWCVVGSRDG